MVSISAWASWLTANLGTSSRIWDNSKDIQILILILTCMALIQPDTGAENKEALMGNTDWTVQSSLY